ncbi:MAG: hypothetical protein JKY34_10565 [Kordiimonadaceae bacterium]|nr:hypothetical protein [Kordiimonadaceae bacterium]
MIEYSGLIVDAILAVLLIAAIGVCLLVSGRLNVIKSGQAELKELVDQLNTAVTNAQRSVVNLRSSAEEVESQLNQERQKATAIADELSMMTEAGNNLANRIESGLTGTRGAAQSATNVPSTENLKKQEEILAALKEAR